ncbi:hypothetical protein BN2497_7345 [Janthinobacterium sp. CG23_2]|nr:hypothetical protein BN2497_7345 [Janthinobacterium sp. CG23_2]CUU30070.1 hypothetical protein BN3177_7345 [Janthinobacterium sp. CG23_2]
MLFAIACTLRWRPRFPLAFLSKLASWKTCMWQCYAQPGAATQDAPARGW